MATQSIQKDRMQWNIALLYYRDGKWLTFIIKLFEKWDNLILIFN